MGHQSANRRGAARVYLTRVGALGLSAYLALGCGAGGATGDGDTGPDARSGDASGRDATRSDAPAPAVDAGERDTSEPMPPPDADPPLDAPAPRDEGPLAMDAPVAMDAPAAMDARPLSDAAPPRDASPGPDVALGPDAGAPDVGAPPACSTGLAERAVVTDLSDLAVASCSSFAGISTSTVSCVRLAGAGDGSVRVAYADRAGTVHVLTVDATGRRATGELTVPGADVRAVYAYPDGDVAVLVLRGIVLNLVRLGPDGATRFDRAIVGDMGMAATGTRWGHASIRSAGLSGTATAGNVAVYTTVGGNFGAQGVHEGDFLRTVNSAGVVQSGGWDWGCSHSLDLRVAQGSGALAPVCLADVYPRPGIVLNNRTQLVAAPGWNQGGSISSGYASRAIIPVLGGVVPDGAGYYVSFASNDGRMARDVAILRFEGTTAAPRRWLTTGPANALAYSVDLVRLGDGMLAYWEWVSGTETSATLQELDATAAPRGAPLRMLATDAANPLAFRAGETPAVSLTGGDAAYVGYRSGRAGPLRLVRVRACR